MRRAPKLEKASLYDLEVKSGEDDAWYSAHVVLDADVQTLTVDYSCSPRLKIDLSAAAFQTDEEVDELVARFRPVSHPVEDNQCGIVSIGTTVCAAHTIGDDDLRYYDAVIDTLSLKEHSFSDGKEECLCTFVLYWQHGRVHGTFTAAKISSICTIIPVTEIDRRIAAFAKMAKEKIKSCKNNSTSNSKSRLFVEKYIGSCQNKPLEIKSQMRESEDYNQWTSQDEDMAPKHCTTDVLATNYNQWTGQDEDMAPKRCTTDVLATNYNQWTGQDEDEDEDEDMAPKHCTTDGLATNYNHYCILISNLEKDITSSAIKNFIYKQTAILPDAYVFPRLLSDPFARGAIVADCQKKVQIIYKFLDSPNHLIVSSRGRPWVITQKDGTFGSNILNLMPIAPDQIICEITGEELKVVLPGTESYERAKRLRDLFVEYINHESKLRKKLDFEEKRIHRSC